MSDAEELMPEDERSIDSDGWRTLAPKARWQFYLSSAVSFLVGTIPFVTAVAMGLWAAFDLDIQWIVGGWFCVILLDLVETIWMPWLVFERWRWMIREGDLILRRGVFIRRETSIPLSRVQHVDVRSGIVEQWFGLATVRIHTASGLRGDGAIPGLELDEAEELRDELVLLGGDDGV